MLGCSMSTCPVSLIDSDVSMDGPDEQSIITYVSQFLEHFPGLDEVTTPPSTF